MSQSSMAQHQRGHWQMPGIHIPQSQYQAPILDYYVGQKPQVWDDQQPVEQFLGAVAKRSWLRFDYIHWTLSRPGSMPIGAPVTNLSDPQTVFDNLNGGVSAGVAVAPTTGNLALDDSKGVRGTWGVDLANAELELEFFGTEQNTDGFAFSNLAAGRAPGVEALGTVNRPNIVTPLLFNGAASTADSANYLIYDDSFQVDLSSQIWGAEAVILSKPYLPDSVTSWQWLGGFRYVAYEEAYNHVGVSNSGGLAATDTVSRIGAQTVNNMYGAEVGARMSLNHRWCTFSATPRIAFALNDYSAETYSGPLAGTEDGFSSRISSGDIEFTPIVQVSFTGEIHVTPNFSVFGGYDFMWIYRMTRPFDNIVYNSVDGLAGAFAPSIEQEVDLESFYTRGLSIGCVLRY